MLYSCGLCGKDYKSSKAHAEHLKSRGHMMRASEGTSHADEKAIIKPLPQRVVNRPPPRREVDNSENEECEDEWEEVDPEEDLVDEARAAKSLTDLNVNEHGENVDMEEDADDFEELDPSYVEYLKDPKGLLTYLLHHPFSQTESLEAVRKPMEAKSHCKVHYGDGDDDEEVELEEFYDYSSRSMGLTTIQSREKIIVRMKSAEGNE
ncbi:Cytoplasmic 60S subunit biogenesis factor REI1 1 [Glycine soja]